MTPVFDVVVILIIAFVALAAAYLIHRLAAGGREVRKFSGKMLVTCPETNETASVKVATGRAALAAMAGKQHVELSQCSRWPERGPCDEPCLDQLIADPEAHSVWTIASKWYQGKTCAYCGRPISELSHLDHSPGLIGFDGKVIEWDQLRPETLPEQLASARPVCWNCTVMESFRQEHPELVVERPWKH